MISNILAYTVYTNVPMVVTFFVNAVNTSTEGSNSGPSNLGITMLMPYSKIRTDDQGLSLESAAVELHTASGQFNARSEDPLGASEMAQPAVEKSPKVGEKICQRRLIRFSSETFVNEILSSKNV